jgi:glutamate racemase
MSEGPAILVFDSGLGGLSVFREIVSVRPDARYLYVADDVAFPYGRFSDRDLIARVMTVMSGLINAHQPDLAVIACNTASTLVLPDLRRNFSISFIGTVPAIKPACASSRSKLVSVLGTEGTVQREYTRSLIRDFGQSCDVTLVGARRLAVLAEAHLRGEPVEDADILAEIAPCFVEKPGARTDTVVLACTHYPLLLERLQALAPWPVNFVDPAPAIARRVVDLIGPAADVPQAPPTTRIYYTSGRRSGEPLASALAAFGVIDGPRHAAAPV